MGPHTPHRNAGDASMAHRQVADAHAVWLSNGMMGSRPGARTPLPARLSCIIAVSKSRPKSAFENIGCVVCPHVLEHNTPSGGGASGGASGGVDGGGGEKGLA